MKVLVQMSAVALASLLMTACGGKGSDSAKGTPAPSTDVTSDFVGVLQNRDVQIVSADGSTSRKLSVQVENGRSYMWIHHPGDCSYWVKSRIEYVQRFDSNHFKIKYRDLHVQIDDSTFSRRHECHSVVNDRIQSGAGKTHEKLFCGYSNEGLDFTSCNGSSHDFAD